MPFRARATAAVDVVAPGDSALLRGESEAARARAVAGVGGQRHRAVQGRRSGEAVLGAGEVAGRPARPARDAVEAGLDRLATRVAGRKDSSLTVRVRREPRLDASPCFPEGAGVDDQVADDRKPCERLEQKRRVRHGHRCPAGEHGAAVDADGARAAHGDPARVAEADRRVGALQREQHVEDHGGLADLQLEAPASVAVAARDLDRQRRHRST